MADPAAFTATAGRLCPWCGDEVPAQSGPGRRRWWCSERCKREANRRLRHWRDYRGDMQAELEQYRWWVASGGPYGSTRAARFVASTLQRLDEIDAEISRLEAMTDPRQGART